MMTVDVHEMKRSEISQTYPLMKGLAEYEHYIDSFAITEETVLRDAFETVPPKFHCLVATVDGQVKGMLVYYFLPYTAQDRADIYMKELYIDESARGQKLGTKLMDALKRVGREHGCGVIKWTCAPWNKKAQEFYKKQGGEENHDWLDYQLTL